MEGGTDDDAGVEDTVSRSIQLVEQGWWRTQWVGEYR